MPKRHPDASAAARSRLAEVEKLGQLVVPPPWRHAQGGQPFIQFSTGVRVRVTEDEVMLWRHVRDRLSDLEEEGTLTPEESAWLDGVTRRAAEPRSMDWER